MHQFLQSFGSENADAPLLPWLLGHVLPFWLQRTRDVSGGFVEGLTPGGEPVRDPTRTTLVQARLTYTFAHAYVLSGEACFRKAAEHGYAFLARALRAPEGGWYRAVTADGAVLDETRDAYHQAFILLAMAWYYQATKQQEAIDTAHATWDSIEEHLADPHNGGFLEEWLPGRHDIKLPRRQNPHMHLLEGFLAMYVATGDRAWLQRSRQIVDLFKTRFVDQNSGALIEFFGERWTPATGEDRSLAAGELGRWREPGHQFEWVWLLLTYFRHTGDESVLEYANRLFQFGSQFGIERENGLPRAAFDGVDAEGRVIDGRKLLWPQTEYIKALAARGELLQDRQAWPPVPSHLGLIAHFMKPDGASWHNHLERDGTPIREVTPSRVLYHLWVMGVEVDRVARLVPLPTAGTAMSSCEKP